jgi:hypothetical protein
VVVEPSLARMASHRAPASWSWPEPGWEWSQNGANGRTMLATRRRWRESLPAGDIAYPPHWRWAEVKSPWPRPWWPRPGPIDSEEWKSLFWVRVRVRVEWWRSPSSRPFLQSEARVVVVHVGRPVPLVHRLACSVVVRPPDKRAIA